jgi:hypothetical protein
MILYAVFLCATVGGREICVPTAYKDDPTEAACDAHKRGMGRVTNPGVTVVCMKKTVPAWDMVR